MRYTEEELKWLKATFKDNFFALKALRKVFLPEFQYDAPIGQTVDLWVALGLEQMPKEDRETFILARNKLIMHIEKQLQEIKLLSEMPEETPDALEARRNKNSAK